MAQAVTQLYPGAKFSIGPAIDDGFYYDFDLPDGTHLLRRRPGRHRGPHAGDRRRRPALRPRRARAGGCAGAVRRPAYKREIIERVQDDDGARATAPTPARSRPARSSACTATRPSSSTCAAVRTSPSTGRLGHFKLMKVAGAYWRGNENGPMLQRIYGTAWETKAALTEHLHRLEEAEKRDHRRLAVELDLLSFPSELGGGLAVWHPKGGVIRKLMEDYSRARHAAGGYEFVYTPAPGHGRSSSRPPATSIGTRTSMYPAMEHGQRVVLPEAHELPDALPDLPQPDAQLPGAAAAAVRAGHRLPLRAGGHAARPAAHPRLHAGRQPHLLHRASRPRTRSAACSASCSSVLRAFGFEEFEANLSTRDPIKSIGAEDGVGDRHRDAPRRAGGRGSQLRDQGGRRRLLRAEDRHRRARRHRSTLAAVDHPVRLQPAGAVRAGVRRRRQRAAPAGDDPPRPVRVRRAVLRRADRALRRRLPDLAGPGPGPGAAGGRGRTRPMPPTWRPGCGARASGSTRSDADDELGKRVRAAKLEKLPYVLVVGDDDVAARDASASTPAAATSSATCSSTTSWPACGATSRSPPSSAPEPAPVLERLWNGWRTSYVSSVPPPGDEDAGSASVFTRILAVRPAGRGDPHRPPRHDRVRHPQRLPVLDRAHARAAVPRGGGAGGP